ncbi:MAG: twin-arginine translocation pathway signal [Phycisphaera sp.]|nr:twin-arginine translocation pathway signal [Phycisphaera sp.]
MSQNNGPTRRQFMESAAVTSAGLMALSAMGETRGEAGSAGAAAFRGDFAKTPDRVWAGPEYWANPMEDWRVADGQLECISRADDRNVHLLKHQMAPRAEAFEMSVRLGMTHTGKNGSGGFRFGIHDEVNDYRGNCFFGGGWVALVKSNRTLMLAGATAKLDDAADLADITLKLSVRPAGDKHAATLTATNAAGKTVGQVDAEIKAAPDQLYGNVALVNNHGNAKDGSQCRFNAWTVSGDKFDYHPQQAFGPILFALHTLSNSRGDDGYVMKITAQLPPMGKTDPQSVTLEVQRDGKWTRLAEQPVDADACTATFRIAKWDPTVATPYRLVYGDAQYAGTIRKEPLDRPLVIGSLTCQFYHGFPYEPVARNLATADPDMLYFSGDQIYEPNGGYGIIRNPADRAILNYLRKWYLFGWAFGDVMRDRPTVCLPDDHDVLQGNIWGEAGKPMREGGSTSSDGGYMEPARMVNVVHRTNCGHNPDFFDPTPVQQDISVYYGDMVYGRVSFAIVADRQFKSGPEFVDTGKGRGDWVPDPNFDTSTLDKPGLELLGDRQHKFLEHWVGDWRGADMKVLLSETVFANAATHHGNHDNFLLADLDSGGWPQTPRNHALRIIRKAFPIHLNGDQHLTTLLQYGVDEQHDAFWSFTSPAISNIYQRWWRTDEIKRPVANRPDHNLPNTGEYRDGFGNLLYMYAVGNPVGTGRGKSNRYDWADDRTGGFGVIRVDRAKRTYTCESYRFLIDLNKPGDADQYPGFPHTIAQRDNYARKITGRLPKITADGVKQPVLKVIDQSTNELVYAIRLTDSSVEPWVFGDSVYTVQLGDPDTDQWTTRKDQKPV